MHSIQALFLISDFLRINKNEFSVDVQNTPAVQPPAYAKKNCKSIVIFLFNIPLFSPDNIFFGYSEFQLSILRELNVYPPTPSLEDSSILIISLSLIIFANISIIMQSNFLKYLPLIIFTVLGLLASQYNIIRIFSHLSLYEISKSCGFTSIRDLIQNNITYIVDSATRNLESHYSACNSITIVCVLIDFFPCEQLLTNHLIEFMYVLIKMTQEYQESGLCLAIQAFTCYVNAVSEMNPVKKQKSSPCVFRELDDSESVFNYFLALTHEKNYNFDSNGKSIEKSSDLPEHIELTHDIIDTCSHFITSYSKSLSICAMKACEIGLSCLSEYDDQRLQLVHKVWVPLMYHVKNQNVKYYPSILSLVTSLTKHSSEFVSYRVSKEFLPHLLLSLNRELKSPTILCLMKSNQKIISIPQKTCILMIESLKTILASIEIKESDQYKIFILASQLENSTTQTIQNAAIELKNLILPCNLT
ncbi:hypothetical protein HZS_2400 [Henneguya salminicola]|nr:hypothetical protein HZS_2400 [Henneguya salminicola]